MLTRDFSRDCFGPIFFRGFSLISTEKKKKPSKEPLRKLSGSEFESDERRVQAVKNLVLFSDQFTMPNEASANSPAPSVPCKFVVHDVSAQLDTFFFPRVS